MFFLVGVKGGSFGNWKAVKDSLLIDFEDIVAITS